MGKRVRSPRTTCRGNKRVRYDLYEVQGLVRAFFSYKMLYNVSTIQWSDWPPCGVGMGLNIWSGSSGRQSPTTRLLRGFSKACGLE